MTKECFFTFVFSLLFSTVFGQEKFEKGSFVTSIGETVECYVQNMNWIYTPTSITIKRKLEGSQEQLAMSNLSSFEIEGKVKFIKHTVDLEISSDNTEKLSSVKAPSFEKREALLKVLTEGRATLFAYEENRIKRYFYALTNQEVKPLVYKRYYKGKAIAYNELYKQELYLDLKDCSTLTRSAFQNLKYTAKSLNTVFSRYNICSGENRSLYVDQPKKKIFSGRIKAGFSYPSFDISHASTPTLGVDFGSKAGYRLAIEAEILLFREVDFGLFFEFAKNANFEKTVEIQTSSQNLTQEASIVHNMFEINAGFRYYILFDKRSKLALNVGYTRNAVSKTTLAYEISGDITSTTPYANMFLGMAFHYNRFSLEARFGFGKNIFTNDLDYKSSNTDLSLVLGYQVF